MNRAVEWSLAEVGRKEREEGNMEREREKSAEWKKRIKKREKKGRRRYETDKTLIALKKRIQ